MSKDKDVDLTQGIPYASSQSDEVCHRGFDQTTKNLLDLPLQQHVERHTGPGRYTANQEDVNISAPPPGAATITSLSNPTTTHQLSSSNSDNDLDCCRQNPNSSTTETRPPPPQRTQYHRFNPTLPITAQRDEDLILERRGQRRPFLLLSFHNVSSDGTMTTPQGQQQQQQQLPWSRTSRTSRNALVAGPLRARSSSYARTSDMNPGQPYHYG